MNLGFIGVGQVGGTLARRFGRGDHQINLGTRNPEDGNVQALAKEIGPRAKLLPLQAVVASSDIIFLATPWNQNQAILEGLPGLAGKVLVDCTNPLKSDLSGLVAPVQSSGAEQIQSWIPKARVVKALNTVGYNIMADPRCGDRQALMYYCGDDQEAKALVKPLLLELGFDPVDAGPLASARLLEPLALLWISTAYKFGIGREHALCLVRR